MSDPSRDCVGCASLREALEEERAKVYRCPNGCGQLVGVTRAQGWDELVADGQAAVAARKAAEAQRDELAFLLRHLVAVYEGDGFKRNYEGFNRRACELAKAALAKLETPRPPA